MCYLAKVFCSGWVEGTSELLGCQWLVLMCLFTVTLPVAKGCLLWVVVSDEELLCVCPALHTVTTTSVCAVLRPVHWGAVLQAVGLQPVEEEGDSRAPAGALGMAEVKDLFVVSDRRVVTLVL